MQDNDPKHTGRVAKAFYNKKAINWWPTPASSTDFNPTERVQRELKYVFHRKNSETIEQAGACRRNLFVLN